MCPQPAEAAPGATNSPSSSEMPANTTLDSARLKKGLEQLPVPEKPEHSGADPQLDLEEPSITRHYIRHYMRGLLKKRKAEEDDVVRKEQDRNQAKGPPILCLKCNKTFETAAEQENHIKTSPIHICCQICKGIVEFEGFLGLYIHIKDYHPHLLLCDRCDHPSATAEEHRIHSKSSPRGFCCQNCDNVVETWSAFTLCSHHKISHSLWYCNTCEHYCKSVGEGEERVECPKIHYSCQLCDDVEFEFGTHLRTHYRDRHSLVYCCTCDKVFECVEDKISHVRTSEKHHCCQQCEEVIDFKDGARLRSHYKFRHPSLYCRICDLLFPNFDMSNAHMRDSHNFCDGCHQFFSTAAHRKICEKLNPREKKKNPNPDPKPEDPETRVPGSHYETLGISPKCSHEEIIKAAKEMRVKAHPDRLKRAGGLTEEQERGIDLEAALVGQAADILSDPVLRRMYDMKLRA